MRNKRIATSLTIVLGASFVFFGLNGLIHFLPEPAMNEPAQNFITALLVKL